MGSESSNTSKKKQLKVANINFAGFQFSPFQYYSDEYSDQQQKIGKIFKDQLKILMPQIFIRQLNNQTNQYENKILKKISKIDLKIKKQRYSPIYNNFCGIINGKFYDKTQYDKIKSNYYKKIKKIQNLPRQVEKVCTKQISISTLQTNDNQMLKLLQQFFNMRWDIFLEDGEGWKKLASKQVQQQLKIKSGITKQNSDITIEQYQFYKLRYLQKRLQLDNLRKYDFIVYISILKYVYDKVDLQTIVNSRSCSKYLNFMKNFFQKPYLNNKIKTSRVIKFLKQKDIDVLFMQEATDQFCTQLEKQLKEYRIIRSQQNTQDPGYSLIILKQKSLQKAYIGRKGNIKIKQIFDRLESQQQKKTFLQWGKHGKTAYISIDNFIFISVLTKQFGDNIKNNIKFIRNKFPLKYVVIGATFSSGRKIGESWDNSQFFKSYPINKITVFKKRTNIQFQMNKADILVAAQYNHIIYDSRLFSNISKVNQNQINDKDGVYTLNYQKIDQDSTAADKRSKNMKVYQDKLNLSLCPNDQHLFDQLIVIKHLIIPYKKPKKSGQELKEKQLRKNLGFETSSSQQDNPNIQNTQT